MPRYFFHSADGGRNWDESGVELADDQTARIEAIRLTGSVMTDEPDVLRCGQDFRIEVTDSKKRLLFTIITLAVDAPPPSERLSGDLPRSSLIQTFVMCSSPFYVSASNRQRTYSGIGD